MDHGVRLDAVEEALEGAALDEEALADAASAAGDSLDQSMMMDDLQASAEFRAQLLEVYTERALEAAGRRAGLAVTA
jgi:carbon-monoxide dehydrogenase medium subunit